jgi:hypothetical protein
MNRLIGTLIVLLLSSAAQASDQWKGLWQVVTYSGDQPGVIYHLAIAGVNKDDVRVYSEIGKELDFGNLKISEDSLALTVTPAPKPLPTSLHARREGNRLMGEWVFSHPQYGEETGKILGRKHVSLPPDWQPFAQLQRDQEGPLIDLTSALGRIEDAADFAQFLRLWDEQVEPGYYFLLYRQLHDSAEAERKAAELKSLFESFRDPAIVSRWQSWRTDVVRQVEAAKTLLRVSSAPFYVLRPVGPEVERVPLWSKFLSETDKSRLCCSMVPFLEQEYVVFNPLAWPESEETTLLVTKTIVLSLLPAPAGESAAEEIFRQGLALQVALEMNKRPALSCSDEQIRQLKTDFRSLTSEVRKTIEEQFAPGKGPAAPGLLLASDFVRFLSAKQDRTELMGMSESEIRAAFAAYLAD